MRQVAFLVHEIGDDIFDLPLREMLAALYRGAAGVTAYHIFDQVENLEFTVVEHVFEQNRGETVEIHARNGCGNGIHQKQEGFFSMTKPISVSAGMIFSKYSASAPTRRSLCGNNSDWEYSGERLAASLS